MPKQPMGTSKSA